MLTAKAIKEIYAAYWSGGKVAEIARAQSVSESLVYKIGAGQKHALITGHSNSNPTSRGNRLRGHEDEVLNLYLKKELSTYEIGEMFGVEAGTVRACLKRRGINLRPYSEAVRLSRRRRDYRRAV